MWGPRIVDVIRASQSSDTHEAVWARHAHEIGALKVLMVQFPVGRGAGLPQHNVLVLTLSRCERLTGFLHGLEGLFPKPLDATRVAFMRVVVVRIVPGIECAGVESLRTRASLTIASLTVRVDGRKVSLASSAHEQVQLSRHDVETRIDGLDDQPVRA